MKDRKEVGREIEPRDGIGDGWLRLMTFDMASSPPRITNKTHSTHYKKFSGELQSMQAGIARTSSRR